MCAILKALECLISVLYLQCDHMSLCIVDDDNCKSVSPSLFVGSKNILNLFVSNRIVIMC